MGNYTYALWPEEQFLDARRAAAEDVSGDEQGPEVQGLPPGRRQRRAGPRGFCCGGGRVVIPALHADAATAMPEELAEVFADPRFGEVAQWVSNAVSFSAAGVAPKRSEAGQGWMRHDGPVHMLKLHGCVYHRTQAVDVVE